MLQAIAALVLANTILVHELPGNRKNVCTDIEKCPFIIRIPINPEPKKLVQCTKANNSGSWVCMA